MGGAIFLIQDNGHLMEMNEQEYMDLWNNRSSVSNDEKQVTFR
jgi:hypothetical protein